MTHADLEAQLPWSGIMAILYLSYAQEDDEVAENTQHLLSDRGIAFLIGYRFHEGKAQQFRKAAESVGASDVILLLWSRHSAARPIPAG
jgi:hypothetical protein